MSKLKAALQKHFRQVPQAQFVPQPPYDDEEHDVGQELKIVKGGAGAFVELALTGGTPQGPIAQLSTRNTVGWWLWRHNMGNPSGRV